MGHHFSHPTNKFWRSLHQSGLTPRLLDPTEDHLMLEYGYGLTNLVDRPTSEQSELSTLEMRLNVFNLTSKFVKHKPKIVCFVGKKIWDVYESVVKKTATLSTNIKKEDEEDVTLESEVSEVKQEMEMDDHTTLGSGTSEVKVTVKLEKLDDHVSSPPSPPPNNNPSVPMRLEKPEQLVKIEHDDDTKPINPASVKSPKKRLKATKLPMDPFDATKPRKFRLPHYTAEPQDLGGEKEVVGFTYFWVVPNTSGLERTQLPEQIVNFTALRSFLEKLKIQGDHTAGEWWGIDVGGVERTVEDMKKVALSRKV
ncbi:hypothetical protein I302_101402 [Kwoniella bestiolae CBS 10118]|uniref:Uracil-DNA glycosylase-like domain-containing protein n=1 Tax=Kwoniella bestiolae CBS 10118 TaxID=1296100 RepID=A0AAJ8M4L1_9TREE